MMIRLLIYIIKKLIERNLKLGVFRIIIFYIKSNLHLILTDFFIIYEFLIKIKNSKVYCVWLELKSNSKIVNAFLNFYLFIIQFVHKFGILLVKITFLLCLIILEFVSKFVLKFFKLLLLLFYSLFSYAFVSLYFILGLLGLIFIWLLNLFYPPFVWSLKRFIKFIDWFALLIINKSAKLILYLFIELTWKFFKKDFLHIKLNKISWISFKQLYFFLLKIAPGYYVKTKSFLYWLLYEELIYKYIMALIIIASKAVYTKYGVNFETREDIIEAYVHRYYLTKNFLIWFFGYYPIKNFILKYTASFYRNYVFNFIYWHLKVYVFNPLLYLFFYFNKNFVSSFLFFLIMLFAIKFIKIIIFFIFINIFKLKLFSIPFYVLINYFKKIKRKIAYFFRRSGLRLFRMFTLKWGVIPSPTYKKFFRKCRFWFKYKKVLRGEVLIDYSYQDYWFRPFWDNFIYRGVRRIYRKFSRRYKFYKMSIKFKHKFGINSNWGIFFFWWKCFFLLIVKCIFKVIYLMTYIILYIIEKMFFIIKKIVDYFFK